MTFILAALLIVDSCALHQNCTGTTWQLFFQGERIETGDLSQEECEEMRQEIEPQTPPFTELVCREVPVSRTEG